MMDADEIATRLKAAADIEIGSINYLERLAAKGAGDLCLIPAEIRRQAAALGAAHRIMLVLAKHPDLAAQILYADVTT